MRPDSGRAPRGLAALALALALLLASWAPRAATAQQTDGRPQEFFLRLGVGMAAKRAILLGEFTAVDGASPELARELRKIVRDDLEYSGIFDVQEPPGAGATMAERSATPAGDALVTAEVGPGRSSILRGALSEPVTGRSIAKKSYEFDEAGKRVAAHRFADDIVFQLTGEQGIARTRVAFVGKTVSGQELYVADYDGAGVKQITRDRSIVVSPDWSPDGNAILYTSFKKGSPVLYWIRPDGSEGGVVSQYSGLNIAPAWSRDGKRIALSLSRDGNSEIYSMSRDGTGLSRLTVNKAIDTSPTWAPTGRQVAFTSDRGGSPQVFVMDSEGANARQLTVVGDYNASPSWSPDGRAIAYVSRTQSGFDIYLIDPASGSSAAATRGDAVYEDPTWAPNGRHLAVTRNRKSGRSIVIMQADGSEARTATPSDLDAFSPTWSPVPK